MEFKLERKGNENINKYPSEDLELARRFANQLQKELGDFLVGVVAFGSAARKTANEHSDIDVLVITDDTTTVITDPVVEAYRLVVEKLITKISLKLHITSMTFTGFWEHVKNGDPVITNIIRDGVGIIDVGFFGPLQVLLKQGRIRPSEESIWRYFGRSPRTLLNSRWHVLQATLDLYWAVIDSAHAALMRKNVTPPSPEHVAQQLNEVYVKHHLLEKKYVTIMERFYKLSKEITHREVQEVTGTQYDQYYKEASDFVTRMKSLVMKKV